MNINIEVGFRISQQEAFRRIGVLIGEWRKPEQYGKFVSNPVVTSKPDEFCWNIAGVIFGGDKSNMGFASGEILVGENRVTASVVLPDKPTGVEKKLREQITCDLDWALSRSDDTIGRGLPSAKRPGRLRTTASRLLAVAAVAAMLPIFYMFGLRRLWQLDWLDRPLEHWGQFTFVQPDLERREEEIVPAQLPLPDVPAEVAPRVVPGTAPAPPPRVAPKVALKTPVISHESPVKPAVASPPASALPGESVEFQYVCQCWKGKDENGADIYEDCDRGTARTREEAEALCDSLFAKSTSSN